MSPEKPKVSIAEIKRITKPAQCPRKSAGKNPKNNTVQEKPTGASRTFPEWGFSKYIVA